MTLPLFIFNLIKELPLTVLLSAAGDGELVRCFSIARKNFS